MRINKKRIVQPNGQDSNAEQMHVGGHQRIQSNPVYLNGYGNQNVLLNNNAPGVRSQQQFENVP
jgi:hypothetical protein